ncbi:hypothetical protein J6590_037414 [Homalodisca vitripennis]|nr:hypothetical protein J6590_037414 [Homalodisca vitripennis]
MALRRRLILRNVNEEPTMAKITPVVRILQLISRRSFRDLAVQFFFFEEITAECGGRILATSAALVCRQGSGNRNWPVGLERQQYQELAGWCLLPYISSSSFSDTTGTKLDASSTRNWPVISSSSSTVSEVIRTKLRCSPE